MTNNLRDKEKNESNFLITWIKKSALKAILSSTREKSFCVKKLQLLQHVHEVVINSIPKRTN